MDVEAFLGVSIRKPTLAPALLRGRGSEVVEGKLLILR